MRRYGPLGRYGVLLFGGYLAFFLLRHAPIRRAVPGLLAIAPREYLPTIARFSPLRELSPPFGLAASAVYSAALLAVLVFLFVVYLRALRVARLNPLQADGRAAILAGVAIFSLPLICCPYILSRDIYSYIIYGRIAALYGDNPALTPPIDYAHDPFFQYLISWQDMPSVYGPVWTVFSHGLTLAVERAGGEPWHYVLAYKLAMLVFHIANTALIWQIIAHWKPDQRVFGTLLYAWNPVAMIEFTESAHNDVVMICLILVAVLCALRGYWRRAIAALVAAALVKWIAAVLLPLFAIVWLYRQPTWPRRLLLAGQAAAIVILGVVLLHLPYGEVARSIGAPVTNQGGMRAENSIGALAIRGAQDLLAWLGVEGVRENAWRQAAEAIVAGCGKALVLLAWLVSLYVVWRRPAFERLLESGCWLFLAILVVAPVFRVWYVTWPLALGALLGWHAATRVTLTFAAAAPLAQFNLGARSWSDVLVFLPVFALLAYELWQAWLRSRPPLEASRADGPIDGSTSDEWPRPALIE